MMMVVVSASSFREPLRYSNYTGNERRLRLRSLVAQLGGVSAPTPPSITAKGSACLLSNVVAYLEGKFGR